MATDKVELARRMETARPTDTVRGVIFKVVLELVRERLGPVVADNLQMRFFKRPPIDIFSYPVTDFLKLLYAAADVLEPTFGSPEAAIRAIGAKAASGFFRSVIGKTLTNLVAGSDPKRLFASLPSAYTSTVSYGTREYFQLGDKKVRLVYKGDMMPVQFHEGALAEALVGMNLKGTVTSTAKGYDYLEYVIEWV
jgi:uncharacterized protein (TIGR02265 family)